MMTDEGKGDEGVDVVDNETGEITRIDPTVLTSIYKIEVDAQVATAKQWPRRSIKEIRNELVSMACLDEDTAEEMIYALPRGGKPIRGASVRFAEALMYCYGNGRVDAYVVDINKQGKYVEAIGVYYDLERNVGRRARVRRRIVDRRGFIFNDDMILVTGNAACAIAGRNAILTGIPKPIWGESYARAYAMIAGTIETLATKRNKAVKAFAHFGVKPEQVFMALGYKDESQVQLDDIVTLRGMISALKSETETVESMFDPRRMTGVKPEGGANPLGDEEEEEDKVSSESRAAKKSDAAAVAAKKTEAEAKTAADAKAAAAEGLAPEDQEADADAGAKPQQEAASASKPAEATEQAPAAKDAPAPAAASPKPAAKAKAPAAPPPPKTEAEYEAHFDRWIADKSITSPERVTDKWKGEMKMRNDSFVTEEARNRMIAKKNARIVELGGSVP